jgi:signal transduction histidine kinase
VIPVAIVGWIVAVLLLAATVRLWQQQRWRAEVVARACHEVRGPLTAVGLGISLWGQPGGLSPTRVHAIEIELRRAALALADLDASNRSCTSGGLERLERVDLGELITDAVTAAEGSAASAGVTVQGEWGEPAIAVWGERLRLAQAVGNLTANAIEHGTGPVTVSAIVRRNMACIEVKDAGGGLPATISELTRHSSIARGPRGRGLAIARAVARGHGGDIEASATATGATVVLALPVFRTSTIQPAILRTTPGYINPGEQGRWSDLLALSAIFGRCGIGDHRSWRLDRRRRTRQRPRPSRRDTGTGAVECIDEI